MKTTKQSWKGGRPLGPSNPMDAAAPMLEALPFLFLPQIAGPFVEALKKFNMGHVSDFINKVGGNVEYTRRGGQYYTCPPPGAPPFRKRPPAPPPLFPMSTRMPPWEYMSLSDVPPSQSATGSKKQQQQEQPSAPIFIPKEGPVQPFQKNGQPGFPTFSPFSPPPGDIYHKDLVSMFPQSGIRGFNLHMPGTETQPLQHLQNPAYIPFPQPGIQ